MRNYWPLILAAVVVGTACAQPPPDRPGPPRPPRGGPDEAMAGMMRGLFSSFEENIGWENEQINISHAVEQIYQQNGWNSEADSFSLGVIEEVSRIPPWQMRDRLDALSAALADRYALDEDQTTDLRQRLGHEAFGVFRQFGAQILPVAAEALQTRMRGEPFTAEQVQRWSEVGQTINKSMRGRFDDFVGEFQTQLTPEQRALFDVDVQAANRRMDRMDELSAQWRKGEWKPSDWGLQSDPLHADAAGQNPPADRTAQIAAAQDGSADEGAGEDRISPAPEIEQAGKRNASPAGAEPPIASPQEAGPPRRPSRAAAEAQRRVAAANRPLNDWERYVQDFIARYHLDDAQQTRAWSIYRSAQDRREAQEKRLALRVGELNGSGRDPEAVTRQRATLDKEHARVCDTLFDALKRRLDRLPTSAQRAAAESTAPQTPVWRRATSAPAPVTPHPGGP